MATTKTFLFKNELTETLLEHKKWIRENPRLARVTENSLNKFKVEVFADNHDVIAKDLYKALKSSGFLDKYALFSIHIDPME